MLIIWFEHDAPFEYVKAATAAVASMIPTEKLAVAFIQSLVKDIDNVDMDEEGRMWHPIFGAVNQSMLSAGACGVILPYLTDIARMGDSCLP